MRWSLRWRLTLWITVTLAVLLAGFAGLVYALERGALLAAVDRSLTRCLEQLDREPRIASNRDLLRHWIEEFWDHEHVACVVYGSNGRVVDRTAELAEDAIPQGPNDPSSRPEFASATLPIMERQRLLSASLPHATDGRTVVLMGSLAEADLTLAQLRTVLFTAVPVMLLVSALLAYFLAGRALAPMASLARATDLVTADALDRRLPIANPHDELGRLTQTINAMFERLERSFAEIRRFTADASHELRTPLAAIRTEAEVALGHDASIEEHRQLLGSILEECDRLTRLTDQLLTLTREDLSRPGQPQDVVDLAVLVSLVCTTMGPLAEVKGIRLAVSGGTSFAVRGDAGRLRQVFYNLLDNAVKYTSDGGQVEAHVHDHDGAVAVEVRDTGIGIPAECLPRVFDRFFRVDKARGRETGGVGLGLSIVQSIVRSHGGHVELSSIPGQGTTCTVTFPAASDRI